MRKNVIRHVEDVGDMEVTKSNLATLEKNYKVLEYTFCRFTLSHGFIVHCLKQQSKGLQLHCCKTRGSYSSLSDMVRNVEICVDDYMCCDVMV